MEQRLADTVEVENWVLNVSDQCSSKTLDEEVCIDLEFSSHDIKLKYGRSQALWKPLLWFLWQVQENWWKMLSQGEKSDFRWLIVRKDTEERSGKWLAVMVHSVWARESSDVFLKTGRWCKVSVSPRMSGCISRREHSNGGIINYDPSANRDKRTLNTCRVVDFFSPLGAEESYRCRQWNGKSRGLPINWDFCLNMES